MQCIVGFVKCRFASLSNENLDRRYLLSSLWGQWLGFVAWPYLQIVAFVDEDGV